MIAGRWRRAWANRATLAEALVAISAASLAIRFLPFNRVIGWVSAALPAGRHAGRPDDVVAAVRWAVDACANRVPWRAVCFQRGLAAHAMLRRRGIASTLHYGVAQPSHVGLKAHVWVTAGNLDVLGVRESVGYARLASFPPAS